MSNRKFGSILEYNLNECCESFSNSDTFSVKKSRTFFSQTKEFGLINNQKSVEILVTRQK